MYNALGDRQQALDYYRQALPIRRKVGDRAGEAVTRFDIAMVHRDGGELDRTDRYEIRPLFVTRHPVLGAFVSSPVPFTSIYELLQRVADWPK